MAFFKTSLVFLLALSLSFGLIASDKQPGKNVVEGPAFVYGGLFSLLDFSVEKQNIMFNKQAMVFSNANQDARIFGLNESNEEVEMTSFTNSVNTVVYENLYFNIDLLVHIPESNDRREISYEFIVYPGGNPADISLDYASGYIRPGGEAYLLDEETESLRLTSPKGMQVVAGTDEQKVAARFTTQGNKLQLVADNYEQSEVLTLVCKQL